MAICRFWNKMWLLTIVLVAPLWTTTAFTPFLAKFQSRTASTFSKSQQLYFAPRGSTKQLNGTDYTYSTESYTAVLKSMMAATTTSAVLSKDDEKTSTTMIMISTDALKLQQRKNQIPAAPWSSSVSNTTQYSLELVRMVRNNHHAVVDPSSPRPGFICGSSIHHQPLNLTGYTLELKRMVAAPKKKEEEVLHVPELLNVTELRLELREKHQHLLKNMTSHLLELSAKNQERLQSVHNVTELRLELREKHQNLLENLTSHLVELNAKNQERLQRLKDLSLSSSSEENASTTLSSRLHKNATTTTDEAIKHYTLELTKMTTKNERQSSVKKTTKTSSDHHRRPTVPVLGPFPNKPPLLVGSDFIIHEPTPYQWNILEESVLVHHANAKERRKNDTTTTTTMSIIDAAAPVIALLDSHSSTNKSGRRYATLAAVVGFQKRKSSSSSSSRKKAGNLTNAPCNSSVRLVGIGRVQLCNFFYGKKNKEGPKDHDETPQSSDLASAAQDDSTKDIYQRRNGRRIVGLILDDGTTLNILTPSSASGDDRVHNDKNEEDDDVLDDEDRPPVLMAEFDLLTDNNLRRTTPTDDLPTTTYDKIGLKGDSSSSCFLSPVHALNKMSTLQNQLIRSHNERRKLVEGIKVAKYRLERRNFFEDLDGVGQITQSHETEQSNALDTTTGYDTTADSTIRAAVISGPSMLLTRDNNYGLNTYASMSSLVELTDVAMKTLSAYYSPLLQQEEEFRLMVMSFVCFRALEGFCTCHDLAWALDNTNTIERLKRAHQIMSQHVLLLRIMTEQLNHDLREFGEPSIEPRVPLDRETQLPKAILPDPPSCFL